MSVPSAHWSSPHFFFILPQPRLLLFIDYVNKDCRTFMSRQQTASPPVKYMHIYSTWGVRGYERGRERERGGRERERENITKSGCGHCQAQWIWFLLSAPPYWHIFTQPDFLLPLLYLAHKLQAAWLISLPWRDYQAFNLQHKVPYPITYDACLHNHIVMDTLPAYLSPWSRGT